MDRLSIDRLKALRIKAKEEFEGWPEGLKARVVVHMGTCGVAARAREVLEAFREEVSRRGLSGIEVMTTGCAGLCSAEPMVTVAAKGCPPVKYICLDGEKAGKVVEGHLVGGKVLEEFVLSDESFFEKQRLVVLRNRGLIDPGNIYHALARDGYLALERVLTSMAPEDVIEEVERSGLRGRGGAGFPTGRKWRICRDQKKFPKFIIANCEEGDPGAYMDRSLVESDPHSMIEGLAIGAYAIGAERGYLYIRTEYPYAIQAMRRALGQARELGLLGENILGSGFSFDIEIRETSGAFVCGEETSLIHSIEGEVPEPRQRPPFPAESGLWGYPTVINNVETLANVPAIVLNGAQWFSSLGTDKSKGTKVFSLGGKVNKTGLIEVPMGLSLREIVYDIGGGIPEGRRLKAVQTGGPLGGCIPARLMDLPVDYESLAEAGSIMGSGGMIVVDETTCAVDVAKFFIQFTSDESCGKCTMCRDGSDALLEVLTRITEGKGLEGDIEFLEELSYAIKDGSMCGLGQGLPNPVLSTLMHFRDEYEAHVKYKKCPAVVCRKIISSPCQYLCPLETDVPAYLTLIAKGEFKEALDVVRKTNPLPIICGRVCMAQCETRCLAGEGGEPLAIRHLERFLTDWEVNSGEVPPVEPFERRYDERIAIIGSGPAGLTAGYYLAREGYNVTIFEKSPVPGGKLASRIPAYKLPKELLRSEIDRIEKTGVKIKTNSPVENIEDLLGDGYKAVLIAVGAHKNRKLGIAGEDVEGVIDPIEFLRKLNLGEPTPALGRKVGVIGGGNTAIDAARVALRLGAEEVTIFYRRTRAEMPACREEIEAALEEGVKIEFLVAPKKVIQENGRVKAVELIRTVLGDVDETGRRRPVPVEGSEFTVEVDSLVPAISQDPEIPEGFGLEVTEWNTLAVDDRTFMTSREGVFAAGDAVTGPGDVTTAMAQGKKAAKFIHKYLRGEPLEEEYRVMRPSVVVEPVEFGEEVEEERVEMPRIAREERVRSFEEVERGYTEEMAMREATRCLRCDWAVLAPERKRAVEVGAK